MLKHYLPKLHDSVLVALQLRWEHGELAIHLEHHDQAMHLTATGVRQMVIPREEPWGPSEYVDAISLTPADEAGLQRMEIEMQSGDVIVVFARAFDVTGAQFGHQ